MNTHIRIILFFLLVACVQVSASKAYYFRQYQVQDGLSNNIVSCCLQDANGFMWFGTRDGLNRFDGYSFRVFRDDAEQKQALGSSNISSMAVDSEGILWIGSYRGLYKYNGADETFALIPFTKGIRVGGLSASPEGYLWMILDGQLVRYDQRLNAHQVYTIPDNGTPTSFCFSPQGDLWITLSNGMLYAFDRQNGTFTGYDLFAHSAPYTLRNLTKVYATATGDKLFIGTTTNGAKLFDVATLTYKDILQEEVRKKEMTVQGFIQTKEDEVWIGSESGLFIYTPSTDTYAHVQKRPYDPYSLSTNSLYNFCRDNEGGIWVGTYSGGVNYYSPFQPFEKFYAYPDANVMQGDLVHDICTDRYDNLWIATEDAGLNKLDTRTGLYINYQPQRGERSISRTNLHGLVADGDRLWVGSLNGIDRIDIPSGHVMKHYTLGSNSLIVIMKKLPNGMLLAGTANGMYRYNEATDQFDYMPAFQTKYRIQSILEDHTGVIWIGMVNGGVRYYNPADQTCHPFAHDTIRTSSSNTINDIYEDDDYNLWFATLGGVKKHNRRTGEITRYTIANGFPSNVSFRILPDSNKNLWISTANGLVCLNPRTDEFTVYTEDHGLITNQFNYNSAWKDPSGRMYFGMVKGMVRFKPEEIHPVEQMPKVYLTSTTVYDKAIETPLPTLPVIFSRHLVLANEQSTFNIDFAALSYIAPRQTKYAYQLEGLSDRWTYLTGSHTAYYTKLPPGHYTFKVKSTNVSGHWNEAVTTLRITIKQPWWLSDAAIVVYTILFLGLCGLAFHFVVQQGRRRIRRSIKRFEDKKEKELYQAKIDFFINIAHEIRTPLTLIKSPLEKVIANQGIPPEAQGYLTVVEKNANRLLALVNQLLDFRKTELQGYRLSFVQTDIVSFLYDHCSRFQDTAEQRKLKFEIQANTKKLFAYIDKEACTKIISNLLSNALKYAATLIRITLTRQEDTDQFLIDVTNDGQPIAPEIRKQIFEPFFRSEHAEHQSGTGLGLPLARSLAEMHRGTLSLLETAEPLITFRLQLPVNQPDSIRLQEEAAAEKTPDAIQVVYELDPARPSVLVVEDNDEMKEFVGNEIHTLYNVLTATNGEEALLLLQEYSIQLIVSDIMMPVMDGLGLLKKVKTDLEFSHIPVILLTARNTTQSRLEGLELGADAYIEKPFSMDILLAQITNLMNNRNNIRNYYFHSPIAHMKSMAYTKADEHFLEKLNDIINEHISNIDLDVELIADKMNLSRPTLYRKINALSSLTPNDLIKLTRLKKAAELILRGEMKIYEISEAVGFNSQSYFSRSFSKQFGMSPSQYAQKNDVDLSVI